ncbi:MAG: DUF1837 domain-containing protein [Alphaproteobacteria bacterium]|nr:DUF1837 domain-containing protein [Alphaproteobacteria bacterium]MBO7551612.1 DUF1837 domain-containing protein [Fibrobacter sp.]
MTSKNKYSEAECIEEMEKWLSRNQHLMDGLKFDVFYIKGNKDVSREFLQEACLFSYRKDRYLKNKFHCKSQSEIIQYIEENVIPSSTAQIDQNVRNGDFGEIVVALIARYFYHQETFKKMYFKLNHNKSAFGTDVVSFDSIDNPSQISFFESKVRKNILKKEKIKIDSQEQHQYISVIAYNSLSNDFSSATQPMLDFMAQRFDDQMNEELSKKYIELATSYRRMDINYEIFLITSTQVPLPNYDVLINSLDSLDLKLNPLKLTIVLIDDLYSIMDEVWNGCAQRAADLYG